MNTYVLQAVAAGGQLALRLMTHATASNSLACMSSKFVVSLMQQLAALAAGLGFTGVERLLTVGPAGRYLEATFKANKDLPASQVRPAVHQAATNLVGLLHVLIVVGHLASACVLPIIVAHLSHTATP